MLDNNLYNLMMQATVEHVSLWRLKNDYMKDAQASPETKDLWTKMIAEKEAQIESLKALIKKELQ